MRSKMLCETQMTLPITGSTLNISARFVGEDLAVLAWGGEKPHIGCTVLALPRPSLSGDGSVSCTSSVLNVTGHKDEAVCRKLAESACRQYRCTVVCSGGFHMDDITPEAIREIMTAVDGFDWGKQTLG